MGPGAHLLLQAVDLRLGQRLRAALARHALFVLQAVDLRHALRRPAGAAAGGVDVFSTPASSNACFMRPGCHCLPLHVYFHSTCATRAGSLDDVVGVVVAQHLLAEVGLALPGSGVACAKVLRPGRGVVRVSDGSDVSNRISAPAGSSAAAYCWWAGWQREHAPGAGSSAGTHLAHQRALRLRVQARHHLQAAAAAGSQAAPLRRRADRALHRRRRGMGQGA